MLLETIVVGPAVMAGIVLMCAWRKTGRRRKEGIEVEPPADTTRRESFKTSADNVGKGGKCPRKEAFQFEPPVSSHLCVDRGGVRDERASSPDIISDFGGGGGDFGGGGASGDWGDDD